MLVIAISIVLALHLMCMNIASAGPLVCMWFDWRSASGDEATRRAAKFLAWKPLALLIVGVVFGLLVAGFLWNDAYHGVMHKFMYKIKWGAWELLISIVLMGLHTLLVMRSAPKSLLGKIGRAAIALLAGTNLLYHFPVLFIVISEVSGGYLDVPKDVDAVIFRSLMAESSVLARSVHFWLASFAVTGVALMAYGKWLLKKEGQDDVANKMAVWGARIALVPTVLQLLVGMWVLSVLPGSMQQRLMGQDISAACAFGLSLVGALWLMQQLAAVSFGDTKPKTLKLAIHLMYAVVILMTLTSRIASGRAVTANPSNSEATTLESTDER